MMIVALACAIGFMVFLYRMPETLRQSREREAQEQRRADSLAYIQRKEELSPYLELINNEDVNSPELISPNDCAAFAYLLWERKKITLGSHKYWTDTTLAKGHYYPLEQQVLQGFIVDKIGSSAFEELVKAADSLELAHDYYNTYWTLQLSEGQVPYHIDSIAKTVHFDLSSLKELPIRLEVYSFFAEFETISSGTDHLTLQFTPESPLEGTDIAMAFYFDSTRTAYPYHEAILYSYGLKL